MSSERSVARHALEIAIFRGVSAVGFAIMLGTLARVCEPALLGRLLAAFGIVQLLSVIVDAGTTPAIARVAANRARVAESGLGSLFALVVITQVILCIAATVVVLLLIGSLAIAIGCAMMACGDRLVDLSNLLDISLARAFRPFCVTVARRLLALMMLLTAVLVSPGAHLSAWAAASSLGVSAMLVGIASTAGAFLANPPSWRAPDIWLALRNSRPYLLNSVGFHVRSLDTYFVLVVVPGGAAAYGAVSRLTSPLLMFSSAVSQALMPKVARQNSGAMERVRGIWISGGVLAIGFFALAMISPQLVTIVLGSGYKESIVLLRWALLSMWAASLVLQFAAIDIGLGLVKRVWIASVVGGACTIVAVPTLALTVGVVGAAMGGALGAWANLVCLLAMRSERSVSGPLSLGSQVVRFRYSRAPRRERSEVEGNC